MPVWLMALQIALADAPAIVSAIEVARLPPMSDAEMTVLRKSMNDAVARLDKAVEDLERLPK